MKGAGATSSAFTIRRHPLSGGDESGRGDRWRTGGVADARSDFLEGRRMVGDLVNERLTAAAIFQAGDDGADAGLPV